MFIVFYQSHGKPIKTAAKDIPEIGLAGLRILILWRR